jgi:hypothetical protein
MKNRSAKKWSTIAIMAGALALCAAPAFAAGPPSSVPPSNTGTANIPVNDGTSNIPSTTPGSQAPSTPGPKAGLPAKAKAYGSYCKNESKQHVDGQPGTPFSVCVTAMAKLANGNTKNPRTACKDASKQHVDGQKGTPFSQCVVGGAKLLQDHSQSSD